MALPDDRVFFYRQIATAFGPCGNNREYLFRLEKAMFDIGEQSFSYSTTNPSAWRPWQAFLNSSLNMWLNRRICNMNRPWRWLCDWACKWGEEGTWNCGEGNSEGEEIGWSNPPPTQVPHPSPSTASTSRSHRHGLVTFEHKTTITERRLMIKTAEPMLCWECF